MDEAIPTIAAWRLSTLPRYLPTEAIERVISACDTATPLGVRDHAVILLLARLGLRASEVAGLRFVDLDWQNATLDVQGKYHRKARLPLPQEVGDALLNYLEHARPPVASDRVFIRTVAPLGPLSRPTITQAAARALRRAGIDAPFFWSPSVSPLGSDHAAAPRRFVGDHRRGVAPCLGGDDGPLR